MKIRGKDELECESLSPSGVGSDLVRSPVLLVPQVFLYSPAYSGHVGDLADAEEDADFDQHSRRGWKRLHVGPGKAEPSNNYRQPEQCADAELGAGHGTDRGRSSLSGKRKRSAQFM